MKRPLVNTGVAFLSSSLILSFIPDIYHKYILLVFIIIAMWILTFLKTKKIFWLVITGAIIFSVASSMILNISKTEFLQTQNKKGDFFGIVKDKQLIENDSYYIVDIDYHNVPDIQKKITAILYVNSDQEISKYDTIAFKANIVSVKTNPNFDKMKYYNSKGINIVLSTYEDVMIDKEQHTSILYLLDSANNQIKNNVIKSLTNPYSGVLNAFLLGDNSQLDEMIKYNAQKSGISHIFVVSGLHITLLASILNILLAAILLSKRVRIISVFIVIWVFIGITGFNIPTVRAGIMATMVLLSSSFKRKGDSLTAVFLAGIILVAFGKTSMTDISFLLSFTSTLGIILFQKPIKRYMISKLATNNKFIQIVISIMACSIAANISIFPVMILYFKGISLVGVFTNIIIMPLMPILMVSGLMMIAFSKVYIIGNILVGATKFLIDIIITTSDFFANIGYSYIGLNYNIIFIWLISGILFLSLTIIISKDKKLLKRIFTVFLMGGVILFCTNFFLNNHLTIHTIKTQKAASVVVYYKNSATVISLSDDKQVDIEVEKFLRSKNIRKIENLIIGYDNARFIDDTKFLADVIPINNVFISQNSPIVGYSDDIFVNSNLFILKDFIGYKILDYGNGIKGDVKMSNKGIDFRITSGNTNIGITNSKEIIASRGYDLFIYDADICGFKNRFKQYLLQVGAINCDDIPNLINGYENNIDVYLYSSGEYHLRRV